MAQITVEINDDVLPKIYEAFTASYGYQPEITTEENGEKKTVPNPVTPAEFTKQRVLQYVQEVTRAYVVNKAQAAAADAARNAAESITL